MCAAPLTGLKASTIVLNQMWAATGSQWGSRRKGVKLENLGSLKMRCTAAFWIRCSGLVTEAGSPAKSELQKSRGEMTSAWTGSCVVSFVRKGRILRMLKRAVILGVQDNLLSMITPSFLAVDKGNTVMFSLVTDRSIKSFGMKRSSVLW